MQNRLKTIAMLLVLIALVPGAAEAARRGRLVGKIVDPDAKPIQGVMVTATSPDLPSFKKIQTTDKKGVFVLDFDKIDVTYHYRFDKTGYDSLEANQLWTKDGSEFFDWTLHPATVPVVDAGDAPVMAASSTSAPAVEAYNTGLAALKAKDRATAEAKFQEAVQHDPNLTPAWAALSSLSLELGHDAEAAAAAEKAIALGSTEEAVLLARWQAYKNLKDEAKAAEALQDLETIGRRTEEAKRLHNEAVVLVKTGDDAGAFGKFQEALALDPNLQVSLLGLATAGTKIGRNAEAIAAVETILKTDPANEAAIRIRYNAALALGDQAKLIDALVSLAPYEPKVGRDGLARLAFEAYDANDLPTARERFGRVIEIDPSYPQAYYYLGVIDAGRGANAEAKKHLDRFLQLAPNDPEAPSAREMLRYLKN